ncbi:MAG: wax ester/triacylglycerol synthase family O-acyltransferase [Saprospiraceae bacterium]|nr:wax ester/triacylglycerol synthase family O-acyltransferase [Saprospiraceae bacterium]
MSKKIKEQIKTKHIRSISGLDASFLYIESERSPMHVGSVAVIEGSLDFETYRETIRRRIHQFPKLRKRLVYVPLSIDYPYWVDDPHFDLDMHLGRIALPGDGSWKDLRDVASQIFSEPLDQSRPLWSFTYVEGLDNIPQVPKGSVAIVSKIHHVAIDGMGGAGLMSMIFDLTPKAEMGKEPKPFKPEPLPNELSLMVRSIKSFVNKPLKFPGLVTETLKATVKTGMISRIKHLDPPTVPFTSPASPLNGIISPRRKWNTAILSLDRVKALKNIMETTLNDVLLAICAGALRRYLLEKDELPKIPMVAMVPISTRPSGDMSVGGNQISSMLVQLATNIEDPIERLEVIQENTIRSKSYHGAMGAKSLANMAELVPFGIANQAARVYTRYNMSKLHKPVFNVTITNVPGPQFPLYLGGHKLLSVMGMAPIIDGMGLIITIFSYDGHITISSTSCAQTMPDIDVFSRYIRESANDLEKRILVLDKKRKAKKVKETRKNESDPSMTDLRKKLKAKPAMGKDIGTIFLIDVTDSDGVTWKIDLKGNNRLIRKGSVKDPEVIININDAHLKRWLNDEFNLETAIVQGRVSIEGDLNKAMKLGKMIEEAAKA